MKSRSEMSYSQIMQAEYAEEHPNYFCCGKKAIKRLKEKASLEAEQILKEFSMFYTGNFEIEIREIDHELCYSVGATLKVNGEVCREYDCVDELFIDLNELMLKQLIHIRNH